MSALFDSNSPYGAASGSSYDAYGPSSSSAGNKNAPPNLQFYSAGNSMSPGLHSAGAYGGSGDPYRSGSSSNGRPSLEGNMTGGSFGGPRGTMMSGQMSWWSAFGTGGFPDEPGLMEGERVREVMTQCAPSSTRQPAHTSCGSFEELGVNLQHIKEKSLTVLNPFHSYSATHARDAHMMDDADLTGPLMFCFAFGMLLLLVSAFPLPSVGPLFLALYGCWEGTHISLRVVGQVVVRVHLRRRPAGRHCDLPSAQHDVGERHRRVSCQLGARLLFAPALRPRCHLGCRAARVSDDRTRIHPPPVSSGLTDIRSCPPHH